MEIKLTTDGQVVPHFFVIFAQIRYIRYSDINGANSPLDITPVKSWELVNLLYSGSKDESIQLSLVAFF